MKGSNEFRLNEATIKEAVQEYLDRRLSPPYQVQVTGVQYNSGIGMFEVGVEEPESQDGE